MAFIYVTDLNGKRHKLDAVEGWRVMEIIREHGLPIAAICAGCCACATCHVVVSPEWASRIHPPSEEEEELLDQIPSALPNSRLSCQIIYSEELEGLDVRLMQDTSVEPA